MHEMGACKYPQTAQNCLCFLINYLSIYFCLLVGSLLLCGLSLGEVSKGYSLVAVCGLRIAVAFPLWNTGSAAPRLSSRGVWA